MTSTGYLRLGRYRAEALLGAGGVTETYRARLAEGRDPGKPVALKLLRADRGGNEELVTAAFLDAARRAAALRVPGFARILEVVESPEPFVVTEMVEGVDLTRLCEDAGGRVAPKAAGLIGAQLAETLVALHATGASHGGISPGNVVVTTAGTVVLLDVGIGAAVRPLTENPIEKWFYSAPELVVGDEPTPAADLYSVGAALYFLLCGRPPFQAETRDDLLTAMEAGPPPLHGVPAALMEAVARLLSTAAAERPSADTAARVLQGSLLRGELAALASAAPVVPAPLVAAPLPPLVAAPFAPAVDEPPPGSKRPTLRLGSTAERAAFTVEEPMPVVTPLFDVGDEPAEQPFAEQPFAQQPFGEQPFDLTASPMLTAPPVDLAAAAVDLPPAEGARPPEVVGFPGEEAGGDEPPRPMIDADDPNVGVVYDDEDDDAGGTTEKGKRKVVLPKRGGAARRKGRFAWAYLVGGLVLLAGGAGAVFFMLDPLGVLEARVQPPAPPPPPPLRLDAGPPRPAMQPGELVVNTKPAGAAVWIDGVEKGKTPLKVMTKPGGHRVVVTKEGFRMLRTVADTTDGHLLEKPLDPVDTVLTGTATLNVLCQTKGKYPVYVDGKEIGLHCPAEGLKVAPGAHMVGVFVIPQNKIWTFEREVLSGTKPHKVVFSY